MTQTDHNYKIAYLENLLAEKTPQGYYPTHLIKQIAKFRNKVNNMGYSKNLDFLIQELGFQSWNHYCASIHYTQKKETLI